MLGTNFLELTLRPLTSSFHPSLPFLTSFFPYLVCPFPPSVPPSLPLAITPLYYFLAPFGKLESSSANTKSKKVLSLGVYITA